MRAFEDVDLACCASPMPCFAGTGGAVVNDSEADGIVCVEKNTIEKPAITNQSKEKVRIPRVYLRADSGVAISALRSGFSSFCLTFALETPQAPKGTKRGRCSCLPGGGGGGG
jgi:hypothetical protein